MRYVIFGAGAVGGAMGGRLAKAGKHVVLVARGSHLEAMRKSGLRLITPDDELYPSTRVVGSVSEVELDSTDVVILAVKSQDTFAAVCELAAVGGTAGVVCAQNGVENERIVLRRGFNTYGMHVSVPATHLEAGIVHLHASPISGVIDVGLYPSGVDRISEQIAADLRDASFEARADPGVMRWKYTKLLTNLGNVLDAACGKQGRESDLFRRAKAEAMRCYLAAGVQYAGEDEHRHRQAVAFSIRAAGGVDHAGSSSWQSLAKKAASIETDWLNGEIVLLGSLHGVPTPVNRALQKLGNTLVRQSVAPGSVPIGLVEANVHRYEAENSGLPR